MKRGELWRAARIIIDVKMGTNQMSMEEAILFLEKHVFMSNEGATGEIKRYTHSPGYQMSYLIGKYLIMDLREEMKEKLQDKFTLKWFHDLIISSGTIPYYMLKQRFDEEVKRILAKN